MALLKVFLFILRIIYQRVGPSGNRDSTLQGFAACGLESRIKCAAPRVLMRIRERRRQRKKKCERGAKERRKGSKLFVSGNQKSLNKASLLTSS